MLMASSNAIGKASELLGNAKIEADFNRGRIWLVVPQKNILLVRSYFFINLFTVFYLHRCQLLWFGLSPEKANAKIFKRVMAFCWWCWAGL